MAGPLDPWLNPGRRRPLDPGGSWYDPEPLPNPVPVVPGIPGGGGHTMPPGHQDTWTQQLREAWEQQQAMDQAHTQPAQAAAMGQQAQALNWNPQAQAMQAQLRTAQTDVGAGGPWQTLPAGAVGQAANALALDQRMLAEKRLRERLAAAGGGVASGSAVRTSFPAMAPSGGMTYSGYQH